MQVPGSADDGSKLTAWSSGHKADEVDWGFVLENSFIISENIALWGFCLIWEGCSKDSLPWQVQGFRFPQTVRIGGWQVSLWAEVVYLSFSFLFCLQFGVSNFLLSYFFKQIFDSVLLINFH